MDLQEMINSLTEEYKNELQDYITIVHNIVSEDKILNNWQFSEKLTKLRKQQLKNDEISLQKIKEIIIKKATKESDKKLDEKIENITAIMESKKEIKEIISTVTWTKNRTWGSNPNCESKVIFTDGTCKYYISGSISGCGYDKESTAIAKSLNQCKELLKEVINYNPKQERYSEILGYGISSFKYVPRFDGGVGTSCFLRIFEKMNYDAKNIVSTSSVDVYQFTKK